jgi:D-alanine--poly(phosphoribitol) ligase subunit 1
VCVIQKNSGVYCSMNLLNKLILQAERKPLKLAIIAKDYSYTFSELLDVTQRCRCFLKQKQIQKHDVVGISLGKTEYAYPLMLATMSLGATYFNLDPDGPTDRTSRIIEISRPNLLVYSANREYFGNCSHGQCTHVNELEEFTKDQPNQQIQNADLFADDFVNYIMFTSGSTGFPKGVKILASSVKRFHKYWQSRLTLSGSETFSGLNPLHFDNSVFDFFISLFNGCTLSVFSSQELENPLEITNRFVSEKINIWFSVPSTIILFQYSKTMSTRHLPFLKRIIFGGEGFPKPALRSLFCEFKNNAELINVYGPTEGTCICSDYEVTENDFQKMGDLCPLGKINSQFSFKILDQAIPGVLEEQKGELLLGGANVSPGYVNNEAQNESNFVLIDNVFFYRTGDLVSLKDDILQFHGRIDNQIKIRGHRVELEEVEYIIKGIKGVLDCAIVPIDNNIIGVSLTLIVKIESNRCKEFFCKTLNHKLPKYMRPSSIKYVDHIPLNANGKLDRCSLHYLI